MCIKQRCVMRPPEQGVTLPHSTQNELLPYLEPSLGLPESIRVKIRRLLGSELDCEVQRMTAAWRAHSLGKSILDEYLLATQDPELLVEKLWASIRVRGCQFLGPEPQAQVLSILVWMLGAGEALPINILVVSIVRVISRSCPMASNSSILHVIQLLYRASCFRIFDRKDNTSLVQLRREFRNFGALRRSHDLQIFWIALQDGLHLSPDLFSLILYGDRDHVEYVMDLCQTLESPHAFHRSLNKLVMDFHARGVPENLSQASPYISFLCRVNPLEEHFNPRLPVLQAAVKCLRVLLTGFTEFHRKTARRQQLFLSTGSHGISYTLYMPGSYLQIGLYKTYLCWDFFIGKKCRRSKHCTFAHSLSELKEHRAKIIQGCAPTGCESASSDSPFSLESDDLFWSPSATETDILQELLKAKHQASLVSSMSHESEEESDILNLFNWPSSAPVNPFGPISPRAVPKHQPPQPPLLDNPPTTDHHGISSFQLLDEVWPKLPSMA